MTRCRPHRPPRLKMSSCLIVLLQDGGASPRLSRAQATLYPTTRATMILNLDGLIPATVLPMHADGSIDEAALRSYIGWGGGAGAGWAGPPPEPAVPQAGDFKAAGADALLVSPTPAYLSEPLDVRVPVSYHEAIADVGLPMILFQLQPALAGLNYVPGTLPPVAGVVGWGG